MLTERCTNMQLDTREIYQFWYCDCIRNLQRLLAKSIKSVIPSCIVMDYGDMTYVWCEGRSNYQLMSHAIQL